MYQEVKVHHKTLKGGTVHNVDKLSEIELEVTVIKILSSWCSCSVHWLLIIIMVNWVDVVLSTTSMAQ